MNQVEIIKLMHQTSCYPHIVKKIQTIQTHISYVILTGDIAYKIKKAVKFRFLDFSTLENRKKYCNEELKLNQQLCPEIYRDVVPITKEKDNRIMVDGKGEVIEYAVKMKQFPQRNMMTVLLSKNKIQHKHIMQILHRLIDYYKNQKQSDEINSYGKKHIIEKNINENFRDVKPFINILLERERFEKIKKYNKCFFEQADDIIDKRCKNDYIKSCHGDLHSGNIVILNDDICIFDCIEFNKRFRYIDIASDIGFLAMDLDFQKKPYLSSFLINNYIEITHDETLLDILNFYKSYRAFVRGKVTGFKLNDSSLSARERKNIINVSNNYFDLSEYYAELFNLLINNRKPIIFLISGLTGTGKTTLAIKLGIDYNAKIIHSDLVRKEIFGLSKYQHHYVKANTGLYNRENIEKTYNEVIKQAVNIIRNGENIVIDATFQKRHYREQVKMIAENHNAIFIILYCTSSDIIIKQWLDSRSKTQSISDGRWEIYQSQKKTFEPFQKNDDVIKIDMSKHSFQQYLKMYNQILYHVLLQV
jgi:hypothetical protein